MKYGMHGSILTTRVADIAFSPLSLDQEFLLKSKWLRRFRELKKKGSHVLTLAQLYFPKFMRRKQSYNFNG